jgi:hypothetical protein
VNTTPYIERLVIEGLKGACGDYKLTRLNVVAGPNGVGKTRLADAIDFVYGRLVAGEEVNGRNLRALLTGDAMRVRAIHCFPDRGNGCLDVVRVRELSAKGAFQESRLFADGVEADAGHKIAQLLGKTSAPGGAEWIDFSDAKVNAALAKIGISLHPERVKSAIDLLMEYPAQVPGKPSLGSRFTNPADAGAALDLCAELAKEELNEARENKRAVSKSTDRSRTEVTAAVDPGLVDRRTKDLEVAQADAQRLSGELAAAKTRHGDAQDRSRENDQRAQDIRDRIERARKSEAAAKQRLSAAPPAGPSQERLQKLQQARDDASREHAASVDAFNEKEKAFSKLKDDVEAKRRRVLQTEGDVQQADRTMQDAQRRSELLSKVPCTSSGCWVDNDEIPPDDGPTQHDLAGNCPLLAEARRAKDQIPDLRSAVERAQARLEEDRTALDQTIRSRDEAMRARAEAESKAKNLLGSYDSARIAYEQAISSQRAASDQAQARGKADADVAAAAKEIEAAEHELQDALLRVDQLGAAIDEASEAVDAAQAAYNEAKSKVDAARAALTEATEQSTKHQRYSKDRQDEQAAKDREDRAKRLVEDIRDVQAGVVVDGQNAVLGHAAGFIPPPWRLTFIEGCVGLTDGTSFWSGPGLSAAQRALVAMALDAAMDAIQNRTIRIVHLEVDQLDHAARAQAIDELRAAVESGKIGQAFVMLWRHEDIDRPYFEGFNRIILERPGAAPPAVNATSSDPVEDFDPFEDDAPPPPAGDSFDPFEDDAPPAKPDPQAEIRQMLAPLLGPALTALLRMMGVAGVPKKIEERRAKAEAAAIQQGMTSDALVKMIGELALGQNHGDEAGADA